MLYFFTGEKVFQLIKLYTVVTKNKLLSFKKSLVHLLCSNLIFRFHTITSTASRVKKCACLRYFNIIKSAQFALFVLQMKAYFSAQCCHIIKTLDFKAVTKPQWLCNTCLDGALRPSLLNKQN